ncbi:hypothetical protein [Staphylococcus capitis]|uniref:hypothetical protein n=1 Tax=Staphylococcus capitis TaxID=29388 RepID=UPI003D0856C0
MAKVIARGLAPARRNSRCPWPGTTFSTFPLAFLASGLTGVALRATRHSQIPLGPSFIAATVALLTLLTLARQ